MLTLGRGWRAKNALKLSSKYLKGRICKIKDDNKSKYSSNPKDILKSAKKNYEKLYTQRSSHLSCSIKKVFLKIS